MRVCLDGLHIQCSRKTVSAGDVCLCVRCVHLQGDCQRNYFSVLMFPLGDCMELKTWMRPETSEEILNDHLPVG